MCTVLKHYVISLLSLSLLQEMSFLGARLCTTEVRNIYLAFNAYVMLVLGNGLKQFVLS